MNVFDQALGRHQNQLHVSRDLYEEITADQLLEPCEGERTEAGMRLQCNILNHGFQGMAVYLSMV